MDFNLKAYASGANNWPSNEEKIPPVNNQSLTAQIKLANFPREGLQWQL